MYGRYCYVILHLPFANTFSVHRMYKRMTLNTQYLQKQKNIRFNPWKTLNPLRGTNPSGGTHWFSLVDFQETPKTPVKPKAKAKVRCPKCDFVALFGYFNRWNSQRFWKSNGYGRWISCFLAFLAYFQRLTLRTATFRECIRNWIVSFAKWHLSFGGSQVD